MEAQKEGGGSERESERERALLGGFSEIEWKHIPRIGC